MLLRRIELKGFLSYDSVRCASGGVEPVEIDLRASPLWLVYGHNGAGTSALFDAITFALYKHHRGGGATSTISSTTRQTRLRSAWRLS